MRRLALLCVGILAPCLIGSAHATDIRPGLWEFRSTQLRVAGLPDMASQMGQAQLLLRTLPQDTQRLIEQEMAARGVTLGQDGTVRSCITPEQAKQDNIYSGRVEGNCRFGNVVKVGNAVSGTFRCTDPEANGEFDARVASPERFTTRVNMTSPRGDLQVETDARWISAECGGG